MAGVPQVIAYKVSRLSAFVFHTFVKAPYVGLPNIVANQGIVPELLQENCTARNIAEATCNLLTNTPERTEQLIALTTLRSSLGTPKAMERIAAAILQEIDAALSAAGRTREGFEIVITPTFRVNDDDVRAFADLGVDRLVMHQGSQRPEKIAARLVELERFSTIAA